MTEMSGSSSSRRTGGTAKIRLTGKWYYYSKKNIGIRMTI